MIAVLDTSVLFAAFAFPKGLCARLFEMSLGRHELATSAFILDELARHLRGKTTLGDADVDEVLATVREAGPMVVPAPVEPSACRDPDDLPILGTAVAARADVLITGDKDLLVLGVFQGVAILSPREFFDRFLAGGP